VTDPTRPQPPMPGPPPAAPDPLEQVEAALDALAATPLDDHPEVFARIDGQLRAALDGSG
jgi:hypothetical protein